jgi:TolA-binding protein
MDEYVAFIESIPGRKVSDIGRDTLTFHAAEYHFNAGDYLKAIEGFNNYLLKYPNGRESTTAYFLRAESYRSIQKNAEALKDYIAVTNRGNGRYFSIAAEMGAGLAMNVVKDYSRALELGKLWEESSQSTQSRFEAQLLLMEAAFLSKNTTAGQEYANKVVKSNLGTSEQQAKAYLYLGKIAYQRGELTSAMPSLQKAIQLSQTESMAEAYHYVCKILYDQNKYNEAETMLENAAQASAGYDDWIARNYFISADISTKRGDVNSAKLILESILENYTGNAPDILSTARQKYLELGGIPANDPTPQSRSIPKPSKVDVLELETGN